MPGNARSDPPGTLSSVAAGRIGNNERARRICGAYELASNALTGHYTRAKDFGSMGSPMALDDILLEAEEKMMKTEEVVQHEFATVRTGNVIQIPARWVGVDGRNVRLFADRRRADALDLLCFRIETINRCILFRDGINESLRRLLRSGPDAE